MSSRLSDQSCDLIQPDNVRTSGRTKNYIRVPSSIVLTPHVLLGAMRKLPVDAIHNVIETLIDELNYRFGDPDFEGEPMEDSG